MQEILLQYLVWLKNYNYLNFEVYFSKWTPRIALPLGITSSCRRRPSYGHRQHAQKLVKMERVVREICSRTDTHTDVLITILRHRSCGRSKYWVGSWHSSLKRFNRRRKAVQSLIRYSWIFNVRLKSELLQCKLLYPLNYYQLLQRNLHYVLREFSL